MGDSKDDLSLAKSVRIMMLGLPVIVAILLFVAPISFAQTEESSLALQLRQNTVKIAAKQSGFGFIIGERNGLLYIVTARHVLSDESDSKVATTARVVFYSDQGRTYDADVLGTHDSQHDLAVLTVRSPTGFNWTKKCLASPGSSKRGTQVWFVGKNLKWFVPVQPGAIASPGPSSKSMLDIDGLQVRPGSSGGPLIATSGIVGMIQNDSQDDTRALSIDFVKSAVEEWNYPWDLLYMEEPPVHVEKSETQPCSVTIESHPAGASVTLDGVARGDTPTTVDLVPGKTYDLSVDKEGTTSYTQRIDCGSSKIVAKLKPTNGTIRVAYTGDYLSCGLQLEITIGDKTFRPSGNLFTVRDVPLGIQDYSVAGRISCAAAGVCAASGGGSVDIRDGATYNIGWQNTSFAHCDVGFVNQ